MPTSQPPPSRPARRALGSGRSPQQPLSRPPQLSRFLLRWLLPRGIVGESIRGDLTQEFAERAAATTPVTARAWYRRQARKLLGGYVVRRSLRLTPSRTPDGQGWMRREPPWRGMLQDLRFALRSLAASPGFTMVAVLVLALGIGANTAVFSVVNAVILQSLPLVHPERVVQIWDEYPSRGPGRMVTLSLPNFEDYRDKSESFEYFTMMRRVELYTYLSDTLETVQGYCVSGDYFSMTGATALLGRALRPADDYQTQRPAALISYGYWQREFAGAADILGRSVTLQQWRTDVEPRGWTPIEMRVVGVLRPDFELAPLRAGGSYRVWTQPEVILPIGLWTWGRGNRGMYSLRVLAQVRDGVAVEQAAAEIEAIAAGIAAENPDTNTGYTAVVEPVTGLLRRQYGTALYFLWTATGLVLLIACASVASLLLGRALVREREVAVRSALGAGRGRLVRQAMTEAGLIGLGGGLLGLAVAFQGAAVLRALTPGNVYRIEQAGIDAEVLLFSIAASMVTVLLFGLGPALRGTRTTAVAALHSGMHAAPASRLRLLRVLVVSEVALSLVLLVGAGLMLASLANLMQVDPGFERDNVLQIDLSMPHRMLSKYDSIASRGDLFLRIRERVEALPGVVSVAAADNAPLSGREGGSEVTIAGRGRPIAGQPFVDWRRATPGYFETVGAKLLAGRTFTEEGFTQSLRRADYRDRTAAELAQPRPVVISRGMAERFWPGESALGKRFHWGLQDPEVLAATLGKETRSDLWDQRYPPPIPLEVVGIVSDVKTTGLADEPSPQYYTMASGPSPLFVRKAAGVTGLPELLRQEIEAIDPEEITVSRVRSMSEVFSNAASTTRFRARLIGLFAALAALLTTLGLFGVISYSVNQRTHEIGVRMSVGARARDISSMILRQGVALVGSGAAIGLVVSLIAARSIDSLLYGVTPTDPTTLALTTLLVFALGLLALYLPVRRATRVDPMRALRLD